MSVTEHKAQAPHALACYVLTVSDTRTPDTDTSGRAIRELLEGAGYAITGYDIVHDDPVQVGMRVREHLADPRTDAIITTGGTGISPRDGTFDVLDELWDKRLDGFGELFRMLSYQEIGTAAMLSRAAAGTVGRKAIFALPGSENAVRLAMTKLVLPEIAHVIQQLRK